MANVIAAKTTVSFTSQLSQYWHNGCARIRQSAVLKALKTFWGFSHNASQSNPKTVPSDEGKIRTGVRKSQRICSSVVAVVSEDLICFNLAKNSFIAGRIEHRQMMVLWLLLGSHLWEKFLEANDAECSCFVLQGHERGNTPHVHYFRAVRCSCI